MLKFKTKIKKQQFIAWAKIPSNERVNERALEHLNSLNINGFFKGSIERKFGMNFIVYKGPVSIPLSTKMKNPISKFDFYYTVLLVVDSIVKLKKKAMMIDYLFLSLDDVYINESTKQVNLIYFPDEHLNKKIDIIEFIKSLTYVAKIDQPNSGLVEFSQFLNGLEEFDAAKIKNQLCVLEPKIFEMIQNNLTGKQVSQRITDKQILYYQMHDTPIQNVNMEEATIPLIEDDGTVLLNMDDETTSLEDDSTCLLSEISYPTLYRKSTEEYISINKPVFRIGKEKSYCDYFVYDNNAVSRSHADIITRNDTYFIVDQNSKNKTKVNGIQVYAHMEKQLNDGDLITLANEEFVFNID